MKRGRKSVEEQSVIIQGVFGKRPEPPEDMPERQREIWRETAASEPVEYFNTAALRNLLADYCAHRETIESVSSILRSFKTEWLKSSEGAKRFAELLKMRDAETRAAAGLATKLRLTNQSRYTPGAAATASRNATKGFRPWDED